MDSNAGSRVVQRVIVLLSALLAACVGTTSDRSLPLPIADLTRAEPEPLAPAAARPATPVQDAKPLLPVEPEPAEPEPDVSTRFFTSPSEKRDELAAHKIAPGLFAGLEAEAQGSYQRQGHSTTKDLFVDSASAGLRWVPIYGLEGTFEGTYDFHGSKSFNVDEALLKLGATPVVPWYVLAGHTELPFGEFESHFRQDPSTQVLGEMQTNLIAGGYETDWIEFTGAVGNGHAGSDSYVWVGNFTFSPVKDVDVGVYWTSDVRESVEVRTLIEDNLAGTSRPPSSNVQAAGGFVSVKKTRYTIDFEYITALDSFAAGLLDADPKRPRAWNFEATYRLEPPWEVGARVEGSSDLPASPTFQYGLETTLSIGQHIAVSLEALHGMFDNGDPDRELVQAGLLLRW